MVLIGGMAQYKLSHVQLDDDMGYDTLIHDQHFHGSPSVHACTQEEPCLTHANYSIFGHHESTIESIHLD